MAATSGTMILKGSSGKTYSIDLYVPDAVATNVTFNPSGLAASTSSSYWKAPEACIVVDVIAAGAPTAVGATFTLSNAAYTGQTIRWANQANTLANRANLNVPIPAGEQVGLLQF